MGAALLRGEQDPQGKYDQGREQHFSRGGIGREPAQGRQNGEQGEAGQEGRNAHDVCSIMKGQAGLPPS